MGLRIASSRCASAHVLTNCFSEHAMYSTPHTTGKPLSKQLCKHSNLGTKVSELLDYPTRPYTPVTKRYFQHDFLAVRKWFSLHHHCEQGQQEHWSPDFHSEQYIKGLNLPPFISYVFYPDPSSMVPLPYHTCMILLWALSGPSP